MNHLLQCQCGRLRGYVSHPDQVINRGICYCKDCRAYAHFLGKPREILDAMGGTEVVGVCPKYVTFTQGTENLACMSLSPKGLLRWYAACCNTPIGNTPRNFKASFVGLVHNCLEQSGQSVEQSFGPIRLWVNTRGAKKKVKVGAASTFMAVLRLLKSLLVARLDGSYRVTPFFYVESGVPSKQPMVISAADRAKYTHAD